MIICDFNHVIVDTRRDPAATQRRNFSRNPCHFILEIRLYAIKRERFLLPDRSIAVDIKTELKHQRFIRK